MTDSSDPTQIGRYRILKPLGQGAMATVYLAELATLGGFRRKVALKVVRDEFARDAKFGQLMAREAMIGSLLQHPSIVETLEFNEADGRMFLALEFVEGQTVEELMKGAKTEGRPSLSLVHSLEIIIQVLQGLAYAHSLETDEGEGVGIVHRDLKPGNIMVSRHGQVKVMDFGIAKAKVAMATITAAGQVRGTPIYMAPEQVTGQALDGRADQFAAATVLYEMMTGKQVFIARNLIEIMRAVSRAEVSEPLRLVSDLHPGLPKIMGKMWSRAADERYTSCSEAAADLQELLVDEQRKAMTLTPVPSDIAEDPKEVKSVRKKRKKEPEKRGGMFDLVAALGFGRKKAKPEPPPRKKRRKKRRSPEAVGATASSPGAVAPRPRRSPPAEVVFLDDTTFGEATDERGQVLPPTAPMDIPEGAQAPAASGPARLGPNTASELSPARGPLPADADVSSEAPPPPPAAARKSVEREIETTLDIVAQRDPRGEAPVALKSGEDDEATQPPDLPSTDPGVLAPPSPAPKSAPPSTPRPSTADPFAVPTAAGLKARPELVAQAAAPDVVAAAKVEPAAAPTAADLTADPADADISNDLFGAEFATSADTPDPGPADLPHVPLLRPRVGGRRGTGTTKSPGATASTRKPLDAEDLPTPSMLRPLDGPRDLVDDALDVPSADALEPEDQPTPMGLTPNAALAELAKAPLSGPTRPMQVIDVRAALAAADEQATARMQPSPELLNVENDLRTRPMVAQENLAANIASLTRKPRPKVRPPAPTAPPEDADTAADVARPSPDASQADDWASGEMDPFFFED